MGCGDGNEVSAIAASHLGFKTFLGHQGAESASPIFAYPFLVRWLEGEGRVRAVTVATYSDIETSFPRISEGLSANWEAVEDVIGAVKEYSLTQETVSELSECVVTRSPVAIGMLSASLARTLGCMPEMARLLEDYGTSFVDLVKDYGWAMPPMLALRFARDITRDDVGRELTSYLEDTMPFVSGADLSVGDLQSEEIPIGRQEAVARLLT